MGAVYVVPDNVRATVERLYPGPKNKADRDRVMKALEGGKTVIIGGHKLKAKEMEGAEEKPSPPEPNAKPSPSGKDDKDSSGK